MPIVKVELPSKEAAAAESPRLKRSEFPDVSISIRGNVKDQEHNIHTLRLLQGIRTLSRGIKIVMDPHTY